MTTGFFAAIFYGAVWLVTLHVRTFETLFKGEKWRVVYFFFIAGSFIGSGISIYLFNTAEKDMIYMNFGAALLPLSLSVYLLYKIRRILNARIFAIAALAAILTAKIVSYYVEGEGVFVNMIIVIFASVLMTYLLPFCAVKPSAKKLLPLRLSFGYIIATLGVFVGGDMSYLKAVEIDGRFGDYMTIGGNGVKDGLWLAGLMTMLLIMAVCLAAKELERKKPKRKIGILENFSKNI